MINNPKINKLIANTIFYIMLNDFNFTPQTNAIR